MYKNGEVGLMEILLGASSFQEFLSNIDMVNRITEQDVSLLKFLEEKYKEMNRQKQSLEELKYNLHQQKANVQTKIGQLEVSRGEVAELRSQVAQNNKALESQIDDLNRYAAELSEKIRQAQSSEAYVGGEFAWPSPGYEHITSDFGYRIHPILKTRKLHTGIDIRVPSNSQIVAANNGTVIHANWLGGYGKAVMIDHGGSIVTLYGHNNELLVKVGEKVKKGQVIAKSGSTGMSTGPHLHFEVRKDGNYIDPMEYYNR
jgi:murein DD-endopeptidase MepM/ murein hydrolase activator NlpD